MRTRFTGRDEAVRVKGKHRESSRRWLERQLNDPYVAQAKKQGYRSRAAFKLKELNDRFHFLRPGAIVVDLGSAPGGWLQVALERIGKNGRVVGIDLQPVEPLAGADILHLDFMAAEAPGQLRTLLGGQQADVVLSDMAAHATGHAQTDHLKIIGLAEAAYDFAQEILAENGAFVAKVLQGGTTATLLRRLKQDFAAVKHVKPPASRKDSAEIYVVALGFRKAR
ncbi:MAG TPA: RlmE family RNA methyltransferase [Dongiaceae bacterium]|jgi:23S rRNA (uridine2552-2'-O)-methyltransferase|nr:RlmE family RNA methyltransferase [Dongiaceae bacterium]